MEEKRNIKVTLEEAIEWYNSGNKTIRIMKKYILVSFPEIQDFMEHPRWSECVFCIEIDGHPCEDSTFAVPEDLYNEVFKV